MSELTKKFVKELDEGVHFLFVSERWKEYLDFLSRFHSYSVNNTIAIFFQKPDSTLVASFTDWQKMGRTVRKGEKGMRIIAPHTYKTENEDGDEETRLGFHIAHCFDISQTYGKDIPDSPCQTLDEDVEDYGSLRSALCAISPVPVSYEHIDGTANGYFSPAECRIVVKDDLSDLQSIKTTIHEIAHAWLHSKGAEEENSSQRTREVQAESVAYVVCRYLGLDTSDYSFGYIAGWSANQSLDELKSSLEAITRTADKIIKDFEDLQNGADNVA